MNMNFTHPWVLILLLLALLPFSLEFSKIVKPAGTSSFLHLEPPDG